jgi:YggT family protein
MTFLISILTTLLYVFIILMLIRVVFSWVSPFPTNPVSRLAWQVTEPFLAPVRRRLPPMSGIDLSPMVVMIGAYLLIAIIGNLGAR